ncbi:hypothetical protein K438DRAFT_1782637 [Mycena galopus ATCC 62051]|nr:hypothetical protein K438DRAFT_1782637 [Mycena galopus ATCC 62051]
MLFRLSLACAFASLLVGDVSALAAPHSAIKASDSSIAALLGLLGIVATAQVGLQCSPLDGSCNGQAVCCTTSNFSASPRTIRRVAFRHINEFYLPRELKGTVTASDERRCSLAVP